MMPQAENGKLRRADDGIGDPGRLPSVRDTLRA